MKTHQRSFCLKDEVQRTTQSASRGISVTQTKQERWRRHRGNLYLNSRRLKKSALITVSFICLLLPLLRSQRVISAGMPDQKTLARASQYEERLRQAAGRNGVDARLLWVIAYLESRFRPQAVSSQGARGMMQFMPATARRYGLRDPHDAASSIEAAAQYVRLLAEKFRHRPELILAAYNAGETAVEAYLTGQAFRAGHKIINPRRRITNGITPYRETRRYVNDALDLLGKFQIATLRFPQNINSSATNPQSLRPVETSGRAPIQKSIQYVLSDARAESLTSPFLLPQRSITFGTSGENLMTEPR